MKNTVLWPVPLTLIALTFSATALADISKEGKAYLSQCQVSYNDISIIPKLSDKGQNKLSAVIFSKSSKGLASFKNSRAYYRQLLKIKPGEKLPASPAGWDTDYLTTEEYGRYADIISDPVRMYAQ